MIIDFIGFGGTGKSTFITELYKALKKEGMDVEIYQVPEFSRPSSILPWLAGVITNPKTFIKAYRLLELIKKERNDFRYLETLKRMPLYSLKKYRSKNKIFLSDEGLSIYLQHLKLESVDDNLKSLLPEYLISLYVTEKERLYRFYKRGGEVAKRRVYTDENRFEILTLHYQIFNYYGDDEDEILAHFINLNFHSFNPKLTDDQLEEFLKYQQKVLAPDIIDNIKKLETEKHTPHLHYLDVMKNHMVKTQRFEVSDEEKMEEAVRLVVDKLKEMELFSSQFE